MKKWNVKSIGDIHIVQTGQNEIQFELKSDAERYSWLPVFEELARKSAPPSNLSQEMKIKLADLCLLLYLTNRSNEIEFKRVLEYGDQLSKKL